MNRVAKILVGFFVCTFACCLCLPFISKVRMSANRVSCMNNMKQIGLALHNFHDTWAKFPPGTVPNNALEPHDRLSWIVPILPFLEEDNLYEKIDRGKAWNSAENHAVSKGPNNLRCTEFPDPDGRMGSYVGMAGLGKDAALLPRTDPKAGVFGYDRVTKLSDVTDGLSTTMMVMETNFENGPWAAGGFPTVRGIDPDGSNYLGFTGQFGSLHRTQDTIPFKVYPECSNCLFVDTSARALAKSIDPTTFEALATIAGGEKVELPVDY